MVLAITLLLIAAAAALFLATLAAMRGHTPGQPTPWYALPWLPLGLLLWELGVLLQWVRVHPLG